MRCSYFQELPVARCCAFLRGIKIPTKLEQEKFCANGVMYLKCSTYLKKERDLQKIAS